MDTIREKIIQAFLERAQTLTELPVERVRRSMNALDLSDTQRFFSVWDGKDELIKYSYGTVERQFSLALECVVRCDIDNPSVIANEIMGEIEKILFTDDLTFGGLVTALELTSLEPVYPQDGEPLTAIYASFNIKYNTKKTNPYIKAP